MDKPAAIRAGEDSIWLDLRFTCGAVFRGSAGS